MATTHCVLKLGGGIPGKTESLIMKRKMEKIDSGESLFLSQTMSSLGVGKGVIMFISVSRP